MEKTTRAGYTQETIDAAHQQWLLGIPAGEIADSLGLNNVRILYRWREKFDWDSERKRPLESVMVSTAARYNYYMELDRPLTEQERWECNELTDWLCKYEKASAHRDGHNVGAGRPPGVKNGEGKPRKTKNDISHLTAEDFAKFDTENLYPHQLDWRDAGKDPESYRTRFILKSRKIGATWYFAKEAFEDAVLKGDNQIFISATRAQAEVFKAYIFLIASKYFCTELKGNPTVLSNGATFYYLSTNHLSAQSYGGSVYWDEVFWTRGFSQLFDVSAPIASFKEHKRTLISTPSAISHEAYPKWTGTEYNHGRAEADQVKFSISHESLKNGRLCEDGIWRQIVTLEDAVARGYDRISVEQVKQENAPAKYDNFYDGKFVDDSHSVFNFQDLLKCAKDPIIIRGLDRDEHNPRPYGNKPVGIGYDPASSRNASAVLGTLPTDYSQKFQLISLMALTHMSAVAQAAVLKSWCDRYSVQHMEIDGTGPGLFVSEFITPFFPSVKVAHYNPKYKSLMVEKALSVINSGRFEYPAELKTIPLSFLTVKQTVTEKTGEITYISSYTEEVGHGDPAWAAMHWMMGESMNPENASRLRITVHD